jgi:diguanylate cyclase (GGDEF)-like protein
MLSSALASGLVTVFAVLGSDSFADDRTHGWLLMAAAAIVMLSYRAYASLQHRHLSLERLYRFSQVVSTSPEVDEILSSVLVQAKELLRAEVAEVTFVADLPDAGGARASVGAGNRIAHSDAGAADTTWLLRRVADSGSSVLLPRTTRDPNLRAYLTLRGMRDALVVPLRGDAGVVGALLVGDRMGAVRSFDRGDVLLLETVSNHAGVALQNGRLVHRLRHDALHDALTGLPNRALFQRTVTERLDRPRSGDGDGVTVMLMDLNRFKEVNDTLGHAAGDRLLQEVGARLRSALGDEGLVARLGGDEFALVLDGARPDDVVAVARRLIDAVEHPVILDEVPVSVGLSIGIAFGPEHGTSTAHLLKHADIAMYEAKTSSAGLRVFDASQVPADPTRLSLVSELREALQQGQLAVFVQPKALVADGSVATVEALVRWRHPTRGLLPPDEFIALAERTGLIGPLTQFVLDASLAACASWTAQGYRVGVAVNLSAQGLVDLDLVSLVGRLLRRYALDPALLTLEITESCIMTDPAKSIALLEQLRDMGVRLSVDDFGTGYSSLSYLRQLPVQEVKIDRSFVTTMTTQPDNETIVRSIVNLSSSLGLDVVAEGVEDDRTWHLLHQMGCTYAQGYLLSRPLPAEDLLAWLRDRTPAPYPGQYPGPDAGLLASTAGRPQPVRG